MMSAPALADLDGDGVPEIIMQLASGMTVVRGDGTTFPGWPVSAPGWQINMTPVIGDITGDAIPEVITVSQSPGGCQGGALLVYDRDGHPLNDFYKPLPVGDSGVPALADIDHDGRNELVIMAKTYCGTNGNNIPLLWAYDFGNQSDGLIQWGQFGNGPGHAGVYKAPQPTFVDLATTMSDTSDPFIAGGTTTYVVQVKNQGSGMATNVHFSDTLPGGVTLVAATPSSGSCTTVTNTVSCLMSNVGSGTTDTVNITVRRDTSGSITNLASVSSDQTEADLSNNVASETTTVLPGTDLAVSYTSDQARYTVGSTVHLTATVSNLGLIDATGIRLNDLLPAGLVYVSNTPSRGTYDPVLGLWNIGTLGASASATLQLTATAAPTTLSKELDSHAFLTLVDQADPVSSNNAATLIIPVDVVDLLVTMTAAPAAPTIDVPSPVPFFTYQLALKNNGDGPASNVTMNIVLPLTDAHIDAVGGSQGTFSGGVWTVGSVAAGATATFNFQMIANAGTSGQTLTAQANVLHVDQLDKNTTNDSASAFVVVNGVDFSLTNTVTPPSLSEGGNVTYTFQVQKLGANPAANAQVLVALPSGMIYVSSTASQGTYDSGTGIWQTGPITGTIAAQLSVVATAGSGTGGRTITTTAQLTTTPPDYNLTNNSASSSFNVAGADLRLQQTVSNMIPAENDLVTFNLTITNLGPNNTSGVVVNDVLPTGLTYQSSSPSSGTTYNPTTGDWTVGSLNFPSSPSSRTLSITALVIGTNGTRIDNTAQITASGSPDPVSTNNTAVGTVTVGGADVALSMIANSLQVGEGSTISYTLLAQALAHKSASGVLIEDILPSGLTYVSSTTSVGSYDNGTGVWNLGTIPADTIVTLTINATVNAGTNGTNITNLAHITQTGIFDPITSNNSASVTVKIGLTDLTILQTVDDNTPDPGANVTYTVQVNNPAPFVVSGIQVTDLLPAGLIYGSATPSSGTYDNTTGIWTLGSIAAAGNATLSLTAQVSGNYYGQTISNTASITASNNPDSNLSNNQAATTITVNAVNLGVSIVDSADLLYVGGSYSYTLTITNTGTLDATGVHVTITLPSLVSLISNSTSQGSGCGITGNTLVCDLGTVAVNGSATITLNVQGLPGQSGSATLTAVVSSDQPEFITANNTDIETTGLNILTVNAADDVNDGACSANHCSLREAMLIANALPDTNTISFSIPGTGVHTINLNSALPAMTSPIIIDGTTQPGYAGSPLIELNGNGAAAGGGATTVNGLDLAGGNSTIRALAIYGFSGDGIHLTINGNNTIVGNYIGTNTASQVDHGNLLNGISIAANVNNNVIGGTDANDRNIISGNRQWGVTANSSGNTVQGNYIGLDATGRNHVGNWQGGVSVNGSNNLIGGLTPATRNIISGNGSDNITIPPESQIALAGSSNTAQGNYVGLDVDGRLGVGSANRVYGIYASGTNQTIGGTAPGAGNVIGGVGTGIYLDGGMIFTNTTDTVQGNLIGTDVTGTNSVSVVFGVYVSDSGNNTIGGSSSAARNVIANAANWGIYLDGGQSNVIQGNYIGTDITGTVAMSTGSGLFIQGSSNQIGGTTPGTRNIISGNADGGILMPSGDGNIIQGNYIGVDVSGLLPLPNGYIGVRAFTTGAGTSNLIGGTAPGAGNRIAYNHGAGVSLEYYDVYTLTILSNEIFANTGKGIDIYSDGVTPNDPGDGDTGPNNVQNYPVLANASLTGQTLTITGTLDSNPNTAFNIQFFSNKTCDASGYGQGEKLIGASTVNTDAGGSSSFSVDFNNPTLVGHYITATATNPSNQTSEFSACISLGGADLALTGSASVSAADIGDTVTYTLNVLNNGPLDVTNVVVAAALPAGMTYQSDNGGGNYNPTTGEWTITSLAPGNSTSLQIAAQVDTGTSGTTINYVPMIQSASQSDFNSANNSVTIPVVIALADLEIELEADHHAPNVGDTLQLFTVVNNNGLGAASSISVSSPIPAGLTYVSHITTQGSYDPGTGIWTINNIPNGEQASLTVTVTVDAGTEGTTIDGVAGITGSQQVDPVLTNNTDQLSLQVGIADLGIIGLADHSNLRPGDEVNLTISLTNDGPSAATGLQIGSIVPNGVTLVNSDATKGTYDSATGHWDVADLADGEQAVLTLKGHVNTGVGGTTLTSQSDVLQSDQIDLNASNDTSSVQITVQPEVDLGVALDAQTQINEASQQVTYTVTVTNLSAVQNASNVAARFNIPSQVMFISGIPGKGVYDPVTGLWGIGNLAPNETTTLVVETTVRIGITQSLVQATASIASAALVDPNPANNSSSVSLNVQIILPTPALTLPLDQAQFTEQHPLLTWNAVPGAVTYQLEIGTTSPPSTQINNLVTNSYVPSALPAATYYWRVRAVSTTGTPSPWSGIRSFTIVSSPDAVPELGYSAQPSVTLTWSAVTGAIGYELEVDTNRDFIAPYSVHQESSSDKLSATVTLPPGTYYWRVRARLSATKWGDWSQIINLAIAFP